MAVHSIRLAPRISAQFVCRMLYSKLLSRRERGWIERWSTDCHDRHPASPSTPAYYNEQACFEIVEYWSLYPQEAIVPFSLLQCFEGDPG